MDDKMRIEALQSKYEKAQKALTVAETQHTAAKEQLAEVEKDMAAAGVTPNTIDVEMQKLRDEQSALFEKLEALIPEV